MTRKSKGSVNIKERLANNLKENKKTKAFSIKNGFMLKS